MQTRKPHHQATNWPCRKTKSLSTVESRASDSKKTSSHKTWISYIQIDDDLKSFMCASKVSFQTREKWKLIRKFLNVRTTKSPEEWSTTLTSRTPSCISPDEAHDWEKWLLRVEGEKRGKFKMKIHTIF